MTSFLFSAFYLRISDVQNLDDCHVCIEKHGVKDTPGVFLDST